MHRDWRVLLKLHLSLILKNGSGSLELSEEAAWTEVLDGSLEPSQAET
jgi:hypothetical protein